MGIAKEVIQRARERNILKDEDMVKPMKTKPETLSPKPRQTRKSTPSSGAQKPIPPPKPQSKPSSGAKKRKKGKPRRFYVATIAEVETKSDEAVREVKKSATTARVVKMQPSGESQRSKKPRVEVEQSDITLKQVKETITEQGNLKFLSQFYDRLDEKGKRSLEEATIVYLNKYSRALIEIASEVPKKIYDILDLRKETARIEKERIREYELVQLCRVIAKTKVDKILKENKERFRSKTKVNKIMIGKNEDVHKETQEILREILKKYEYDVVPEKSQEIVQKSIPKVLEMPPIGDGPKTAKPDEQTNEQVTVADDIDDSQNIVDSGEAAQNPLVMTVELEKKVEEVGNEKGEDTKMEEKEKDEDKDEQVLMTRDTMESEKGQANNKQQKSHPRNYKS
ncbi:uncharacterized protein LOC131873701 [Cryptomeria japonica]|uniref:uncharacterized protein LOC131873701 n=1 Tax=Cryptomeria japonica TaxID=3369 RepID=UPI0027DA7C4F|nr:uncharacterized protein LOC131873701 [Cryptomeria japonica]